MHGYPVDVELADGTQLTVDNVMWYQSDVTDLTVLDVQTRFINQARYKGDTETLTALFPRTFDADLNDAHVTLPDGERYRVYARPETYGSSLEPTRWNRRVTLLKSLFLFDVTLYSGKGEQDEYGTWRTEFEGRQVKANLLRLAESMETKASIRDLAHLVMLEIRNEDYQGELRVEFQGQMYWATDTARSTDTIVLTCQGQPSERDSDG